MAISSDLSSCGLAIRVISMVELPRQTSLGWRREWLRIAADDSKSQRPDNFCNMYQCTKAETASPRTITSDCLPTFRGVGASADLARQATLNPKPILNPKP